MLQRIYAISFPKNSQLQEYLDFLEEAKQRDHRKIGKDLELFMTHELVGSGLPMYLPNGATIRRLLERYIQDKEIELGYSHVYTPSLANVQLYKTSGHWDHYKDDMFPAMKLDNEEIVLRPMNCPHHMLIYKYKTRSYKDLPLRMAEFGSCTRNEASGSLHGIMRVRGFVQDDAHIFCTEEQIGSEVARFVHLLKSMYKDCGFSEDKIIVKFSTRPEKRVGDDATWDRAEGALADACRQAGLSYEIAEGEGAFYGPKLEFTLVDALGRQWQCGTIQVDYQLPSKERLNAEFGKILSEMLTGVPEEKVAIFVEVLDHLIAAKNRLT